MKGIILAAGYGKRLQPMTLEKPKCLVPIQGKPLLAWWLELLALYHVEEVLINTHYFADQVERFIESYHGKVKITAVYEPQLLGSAGTIRNNLCFVEKEKDFFVFYADNLTNIHLDKMVAFHNSKKSKFTIGTFYTNQPKMCGIVSRAENNRIIRFEEKPENPTSNYANAGIYLVNQKMVPYFQDPCAVDIGKDVLPKLVNKMYGYQISEYIRDIGTIDNYRRAQEDFPGLMI